MKDVAAAAGVSIATVSATLSNSTYVSPELRERVLRAVSQLGYQPNSMASGLKRGKTSLIGLIVPDITNPFFTEFVHHVQRDAWHRGYTVLLGVSDRDAEREAGLIRLMGSHQAGGTILCSTRTVADAGNLAPHVGKMKMVLVDNALPQLGGFDRVLLDNRRAAELATLHLLDQGHERIATLAGSPDQLPGLERLEGFERAMASRGLKVPAAHVVTGHFNVEDAVPASAKLLTLRQRPTAVFVANNHMLVGMMQTVATSGLSVPGDLSIAAIDDFPWAAAFTPAITTVRQPVLAMAAAAMSRLAARINDDEGPPVTERLQPELVVRASAAPPRTAARRVKARLA